MSHNCQMNRRFGNVIYQCTNHLHLLKPSLHSQNLNFTHFCFYETNENNFEMALTLLTLAILYFQIQHGATFQILNGQTLAFRHTVRSCIRASPNSMDDDEYVTPNQVRDLRKEVQKRKNTKKLTTFILPEDEGYDNFSKQSLDELLEKLKINELVQVKGISREDKRDVFSTAEDLAMTLSEEGKFITLVETKGFSSVMYRPGDDDVKKKIIRRTSYKVIISIIVSNASTFDFF